jgi:nucleotide-binding universal stress UspA family protein
MSFATLMVHVDLYDSSDARIRLAGDLADRFKSNLIGIAACAPVRPPSDIGFAASPLFADQMRDIASRLEKRGEDFRVFAGRPERRVEWRADMDVPVKVVAREAGAADLIIIGRKAAHGDVYQSLDPGGSVLQVGRPILVVPPNVDVLRAENIVIGWKNTREARRAVQDSLPFLHDAKRVTMAEVCEEGDEEQVRRRIDDIAHYLTRHRISTATRVVPYAKRSAADELIRLAKDESADLIVAGAYGHSRLGEWIFGGVTRDLLASCPVCCFLAH